MAKSWAITGLAGLAATLLSAYLNLVCFTTYGNVAQPEAVAIAHIAAAFVGALALARFIQGSREAMKGPVGRAVTTTVFIARVGEFRQTVAGHSAFFSVKRIVQLLVFMVCLMSQFVFVATAVPDGANGSESPLARSVPT